jgi:hypothetical protein
MVWLDEGGLGRMSLSTADPALDHLQSFLAERLTTSEPDVRLGPALRAAQSVASLAEATGVSLRGIWNSTTENSFNTTRMEPS